MFTLACTDMGMEGCDFVANGATEEECMTASAAHGMSAHADKMASMKETMSEDQMKAAMMGAMKSA